jgi:hypothetical protein
MTRRTLAVVLATTTLALLLAAAAPRPAAAAGFVDKQVQAGGLLIQNYVNAYGMTHGFAFPTVPMVKKSGGLEDATRIWPSNPWTGKLMGPGTARGTYTYALRAGGTAYSLTMHLSSGKYAFSGTLPPWLRTERNTASKQNLLLLQRYVEAYAASHGGAYPAAAAVTAISFGASYVWPENPWAGADMAAGTTAGEYAYTQLNGGSGYSLKVMLTSGWSTALQPLLLGQLTTTPGG